MSRNNTKKVWENVYLDGGSGMPDYKINNTPHSL